MSWLADNPLYTKRFAWLHRARRCRTQTIKDVAREFGLHWGTVGIQTSSTCGNSCGGPARSKPEVIGIDEVSIRRGHTYRIVVSDLLRRRAIWFGGRDRSEQSLDLFFEELGVKRTERLRLVVMDMWKPFRNSTLGHAPHAAILFDKFHVLSHLAEALDQVRAGVRIFLAGKEPALYQGPEIHTAFQPRQPDSGWPPGPGQAPSGQSASEHRLSAQRIPRPTVGLSQ